jgi:hypothetical protein
VAHTSKCFGCDLILGQQLPLWYSFDWERKGSDTVNTITHHPYHTSLSSGPIIYPSQVYLAATKYFNDVTRCGPVGSTWPKLKWVGLACSSPLYWASLLGSPKPTSSSVFTSPPWNLACPQAGVSGNLAFIASSSSQVAVDASHRPPLPSHQDLRNYPHTVMVETLVKYRDRYHRRIDIQKKFFVALLQIYEFAVLS